MSAISGRALPLPLAVQAAFDDIDAAHAAVLARLPAARRLAMVCELADFARESFEIQARRQYPKASSEEIRAEVFRRMRQHDA